jgi:uncharacterized protein (TIGR02001 family)
MKKSLIVLALAGLSLPALAEETSPHTLTANVGLYSQYVFRGLAQTNEDPAIQGGLDYSHASGLYVGAWGSNVSWLSDANAYSGGGSLELDIYGGYRGALGPVSYDVGYLYYWYPGDVAAGFAEADTKEVYAALGWKWFTAKYSYSLGDTFGVREADGTYYLDLAVNVPIGETGLTLGAHYGMQKYSGTDPALPAGVDNDDRYSYDDWKLSVTYDLGKLGSKLTGTTLGFAYTDTQDADPLGYGSTAEGGSFPKNIADSQYVFWVSRAF